MFSIDRLTAELEQDATFSKAIKGWNSHGVVWEIRGIALAHPHCNMFSVKVALYQLKKNDKGEDEKTSKRSLYYCQCCNKLRPGYFAEMRERRERKKEGKGYEPE
ncbi:MAG: hypothetical protein AABW63_01960 [Nanoarchaeota archaeon]